MRIKINNQQTKLKSSNQLTNKEYLQLVSSDHGINVLSYINAVTDFEFEDIQDLELKGKELNLINTFIGEIPDIKFFFKKGKAQEKFIFENEIYNLKKETTITLGTRQAYSDFQKEGKNVYEASLFLLAVIVNNLANSSLKYDKDSIQATYEVLLDYNYMDTFPSAVFFLKRLTNG
jgi:hypothetical protein